MLRIFSNKGITVAVLSGTGILATFLFQIFTARLLSPSEYGLVASFLAIVNIAAIGAGALQNAVTVQVAKNREKPKVLDNSNSFKMLGKLFKSFDATSIEAAGLGACGALLLLIFYKPISQQLQTEPIIIVAAALTIPMSFFISRDLGILQGFEKTVATVSWSTLSAVFRLILAILFVISFQNAGAAIVGIFLALLVTVLSLWAQVKKSNYKSIHKPFGVTTLTIIGSSILFAWLTNIDIVFVRAQTTQVVAGNYAVAAALIKATLIIPGTVSLFLLPKLAKKPTSNTIDRSLYVTMMISFFGISAFSCILFFFGSTIFSILFGNQYALTNEFLATVAFTFSPWLLAQALLIKLNAKAVRIGVPLLVVIAICQAIMFTATLPNLEVAIWSNGAIGLSCFAAIYAVIAWGEKER